jgi:hypothetical protein
VCETLEKYGIRATWDGDLGTRIFLPPVARGRVRK